MRWAIIVMLILFAGAWAQLSSVAYPDDPFDGIINPAYYGTMESGILAARFFGRENTSGCGFIAGPGFALGTEFDENSNSLLWGLAIGDCEGSIGYFDRTVWLEDSKLHMWRVGLLSRPARWIAWGASYAEYFDQNFRAGLALRPGTEMITLWADALFDKEYQYENTIVGGELMPLRGVHLYGSYDIENETAWFGARLDIGNLSIGGGADQSTDNPFFQAMLSSKRFRSLKKFRAKSVKLILTGSYPESPSLFGGKNFRRTMDAIADAVDDPKVKRMVIKDDGARLSFAQREEIRSELAQFKSRGGKIIVYAEKLGNGGMYLYSIADTICLPPAGDIAFTGIGAELTYYKGLLDKIGVKMDMIHIGEFKTAAEPYTADSMSEQMREELTKILTIIDTFIVRDVAEGRGISQETVRKWIADAPHTATHARESRMIDTIAYWDEFEKMAAWKKATGIATYCRERDELSVRWADAPSIAVIPVEGGIKSGRSTPGGFLVSRTVGEETTCRLLDRAAKDGNVKGIILRINSPGGSAFASDLIWHAASKAAEKKPLWVSMGSSAASGGYYIACAGDSIFADATTMTGSIGVVGGKPSIGGLYEKLGLRSETIYLSPNANLYSIADTFSTAQRERYRQNLEQSYTLFKDRVLDGRSNLSSDSLESLAQGKIHMGIAAMENGLIDGIAGISRVQRKMAKGLQIDSEYDVKHYSPYTSFDLWELLEKLSILPERFSAPRIPQMALENEEFWYIIPYEIELK